MERDFVEAPSQMLENWCWEVESLSKMSSHYESGAPIPGELMDALVKSRNANAGVFNLRQILLGSFDQKIHSQAKVVSCSNSNALKYELNHAKTFLQIMVVVIPKKACLTPTQPSTLLV